MKPIPPENLTILRFAKYIFKEQPSGLMIMISAMTIGSLLEGLGIAMLLPLLNLISKGEIYQKTSTSWLNNYLNKMGTSLSLETILIIITFIFMIQSAIMLYKTRLTERIRVSFMTDLSVSTYKAIFNADWLFLTNKKIGDMGNILTEEVNRAGQAFIILSNILSILMVLIIYSIVVLMLSWKMTIFVLSVGISTVVLQKNMIKKADNYGQRFTFANNRIHSLIIETISAAKIIKAYCAEKMVGDTFNREITSLETVRFKSAFNSNLIKILFDPIAILILCLSLYIGVTFFLLPLPELVVIFFIFYRITPRMSNLQAFIHHLKVTLPGLVIVNKIKKDTKKYTRKKGNIVFSGLKEKIIFSNISFSYSKGREIIKNISINIKKGELTAFVGSSGAGKTTLVDLIIGLISPFYGDILIDDINLQDIRLDSWTQKIGYVNQETILFNNTIRANIEWPLSDIPKEDIKRAGVMACADSFIMELPKGYDTIIGDRGVKLSGGQRQRIALARALLRKPELLIMDEATSALDAESEEAIQSAIEKNTGDMTIIIVSHRLATVKKADNIYVLENGKIVEHGSWKSLNSKQGRFEQLKKLQMIE